MPVTAKRVGTYRSEIDGLRAVAVLAVLVHHLGKQFCANGYLGVDIFFVISGFVVTASIAARKDGSAWSFLSLFYWRRWRRLWPALALMTVVVALLYGLLGSPIDDLYPAVFRTGLASLIGVSNLYLYRQGSTYFGINDEYNPLLHTWSLGVEEQFYLIWPLLMLIAGFGRSQPSPAAFRRLAWISSLVGIASLAGYLIALRQGLPMAAFFLTPFRLWELLLGSLAFLVHRSRSDRIATSLKLARLKLPVDLPLLLVLILLIGNASLDPTILLLAVVLITALLLVIMVPDQGSGWLLSRRLPVAIGIGSYSLYLWHWPLIVLARFTIGFGPRALVAILMMIVALTYASWRFESWIRFRWQRLDQPSGSLPIVVISLSLASAFPWLLQGQFWGSLYLGRRTGDITLSTSNKLIPGTTISTAMCFLDPDRPVPPASYFSWLCRSSGESNRPVIYFEGDSHAHALFILGKEILATGDYDVSFATRGGCPFPFFAPSGRRDYRGKRYRLCEPHYESRLREFSEVLRPGDVVVSQSALANYLATLPPPDRRSALNNYAAAVVRLGRIVSARGARVVLMAPTPTFAQPRIKIPLSLCRQEWFRPIWAIPSACQRVLESRQKQVALAQPILSLQQALAADSPTIHVFDPMPVLCPPGLSACSSVQDGQLLYSDGSHLTNAGALRLRADFLALLRTLSPAPDPEHSRPAASLQRS